MHLDFNLTEFYYILQKPRVNILWIDFRQYQQCKIVTSPIFLLDIFQNNGGFCQSTWRPATNLWHFLNGWFSKLLFAANRCEKLSTLNSFFVIHKSKWSEVTFFVYTLELSMPIFKKKSLRGFPEKGSKLFIVETLLQWSLGIFPEISAKIFLKNWHA